MKESPTPSLANRKLLACYVPLGDPLMIPNLAQVYADCGVDILEIGIPASNPYMDGKLVGDSMRRSIANGVTEDTVFDRFKTVSIKHSASYVVAMGYGDVASLVCDKQGRCLADGVLSVGPSDTDEAGETFDRIGFVSNDVTSSELELARRASGYIMLQANKGKTGVRKTLATGLQEKLDRVRDAGIDIPLLAGFGISDLSHVRASMASGADGVIIGSACLAASLEGEAALRSYLLTIRRALDNE